MCVEYPLSLLAGRPGSLLDIKKHSLHLQVLISPILRHHHAPGLPVSILNVPR